MDIIQTLPEIDLNQYKSLGRQLGEDNIESIIEITPHQNKRCYIVIRNVENDSVPKINYMFARYDDIKSLSQQKLCEYFLKRNATNVVLTANDPHSLVFMKKVAEEWKSENKVFDEFNQKWGVIGMDVMDEEQEDNVLIIAVSRDYDQFKKNGDQKEIEAEFNEIRKFFITDIMEFVDRFMNFSEPLMMILTACYMAKTQKAAGSFELDLGIEFVNKEDERFIEQTRWFDECRDPNNQHRTEELFCDIGNKTSSTYLVEEDKNVISELLENDLNRESVIKTLDFVLKSLPSQEIGKALQFELNYVFPNLNLEYYKNVDDVIRVESLSSKLIEELRKEGIDVEMYNKGVDEEVSEGESEN